MKIFVAGSTGVIGRLLVPLLVKAGYEVFAITSNASHSRMLETMGAQPMVVDVFDREAVFAALLEVKPQAVMHQLTSLSAMNLAENARIRIEGSRNLVDAARAAGVKRMVAQSISWAYAPGMGLAREDEPLDLGAPEPRKITIDGIQSLETAVAEMSEFVLLRYGMLYGPGTWYAANSLRANQVRDHKIPATDGIQSFVHVEDAARAAYLALKWPSGPVNIVDDEPVPGTEWLPIYAEIIGAPQPAVQTGSGRGERGASNDKARKQYGWEPLYPTWRKGFSELRET